jgi:branched-chain amino acid transport system substrate-binding protein
MPGKDQAAVWTQIRRFNPDWVITWNLAAMHVVAAREMKRNGIPMDKVISVNWFNEVDINTIGPAEAKGLKRGTNVMGGKEHPLIQQIIKELYGTGKGSGDPKHLDDIYYNTGLAMYSVLFEGLRQAVKQGSGPLTPARIKAGLESLRDFDANGLIAPVTVTAKDHGGGGKTRIDMWDGSKWVPQSDWFAAYGDVVDKVVKEQSAEFAKGAK